MCLSSIPRIHHISYGPKILISGRPVVVAENMIGVAMYELVSEAVADIWQRI